MESYNEYLGYFITYCRDNALEELRSNQRYNELRQEEKGLRSELEAIISPKAQELLESFFEATVAVKSMECNRTLLCGLTVQAEIRKRFDASTDEYRAFEAEYL